MKKFILLSSFVAAAFALTTLAAEARVVGEATCAKCDLGTAKKCQAAVVVTAADGKKEIYLSEPNDQATALHKEICKGGKPATVEGTVTEKDGAKMIMITKYALK